MKNKMPLIIVVVLALVAIGEFAYFRARIFMLEDNYLEQISSLNNQHQDSVAELVADVSTLEEEKSELGSRIETLERLVSNQGQELSTAQDKVEELEDVVMCSTSSIRGDYATNSAASELLKDWVGNEFGSVVRSSWDVIFTNSSMATHEITTEDYLILFQVYFDEPQINSKKGIFWVDGQCWLKVPN